jgi:hypothetical protein
VGVGTARDPDARLRGRPRPFGLIAGEAVARHGVCWQGIVGREVGRAPRPPGRRGLNLVSTRCYRAREASAGLPVASSLRGSPA